MAYLNLKLRQNKWYAVGTIRGVPIKKSSGFIKEDKDAATRWILEYELDLLNNPERKELKLDNQPFSVLLKRYREATPDISLKESSALNICDKHLGTRKVCEVRKDLTEYIKVRHAKSKDNSINRDINGRIKAIINFGFELGLCGKFEYKFKASDDTRTVYLTPELRDKFINAMAEEYREFCIVLNFQGLRFGQAKDLTSSQIEGDTLKVTTRKGQKRVLLNGKRTEIKPVSRVLALHPRVQEILNNRIKEFGLNSHLFPEIEYQKYRLAHIAACDAVGITDYRIHDNRKTFATTLSHLAGATDRETASALGQSTTRNVYKYSVNRELKALVSKL